MLKHPHSHHFAVFLGCLTLRFGVILLLVRCFICYASRKQASDNWNG